MTAVEKLFLVGEQAGFTIEQMIQMLDTGVSVDALVRLIEGRFCLPTGCSSRWVM